MRKILSLILVVMFVLSIATMGFAEVYFVRGPDSRALVYTKVTTAGLPALSTTVTTSNRLLGFSYTDSSGGTVGLYDYASLALMRANGVTNLIAEASAAAGAVVTVMFPLPVNLTNGLVVMGTSTGCLEVYYE